MTTTTDLSENEYTMTTLLPATASQVADTMDISVSYVYDLVEGLRRKGVDVRQDNDGRYYLDGEEPTDSPQNIEAIRSTSSSDATVTRKTRKLLAEMEHSLKSKLQEMEPAVADGGLVQRSDGTDLIIHRTDDHFGEHITNQHGEVTFSSEIAEERVRTAFDHTIAKVEERRDIGTDFDTAHLLFGGDIVTNESIYEGQAHDIDENLKQQINRAADVYLDQIRRLSEQFPAVQVVGQVGNHGEIRANNSSNPANADGILYSMLDKIVRESQMDNVTFLQSDRTYYVDFDIRDWNAHLRHGHDSSLEHIGTSAGKQRWLSWLVDHDFDVAFRGHYHMYKEEPINGRPVHMGGSIAPQSEFEESHALSGRPVSAIHGATDRAPTEWTEKIYFG